MINSDEKGACALSLSIPITVLKLGSTGVVHKDVEFGGTSDTLRFDASDLVCALPNFLDKNNNEFNMLSTGSLASNYFACRHPPEICYAPGPSSSDPQSYMIIGWVADIEAKPPLTRSS